MFEYDDFASFVVNMQKALVQQGQEKQEAFNNALIALSIANVIKNQM